MLQCFEQCRCEGGHLARASGEQHRALCETGPSSAYERARVERNTGASAKPPVPSRVSPVSPVDAPCSRSGWAHQTAPPGLCLLCSDFPGLGF